MARKVSETLVDDIDGGKAAETVKFGIDGIDPERIPRKRDGERMLRQAVTWREGRGVETCGREPLREGDQRVVPDWFGSAAGNAPA